MKNKTVALGMSGGVDSSVAAFLLKEEGYNVIGITMYLWLRESREDMEKKGGCCSYGDIEDARQVAESLGIDHYVLNFRKDFESKVINDFIKEYQKGRTPNPCIACNRYIKWQTFSERTSRMGADYISTGHYAKIAVNPKNGRYAIKISDSDKDQSYTLINLTQEQLKKTLFPLGKYSKTQIREMAAKINLNTATKPDSQEICFIPNNNYGEFLEKNSAAVTRGNFLNTRGEIIGEHRGIIHYTIGQRKNLGLSFGKPMYVKEIRAETNEIILGDDKELFSQGLTAKDLNFMYLESINKEIPVLAKIRYSHKPVPATVRVEKNRLFCNFENPQRAVTPGQAAAFYDEEGHILCGGTIDSSIE